MKPKYRIEKDCHGTCRIQTRGFFPSTWVYKKRFYNTGEGPGIWVTWTGTYAEAYEMCLINQKVLNKEKPTYLYPPLTPPKDLNQTGRFV